MVIDRCSLIRLILLFCVIVLIKGQNFSGCNKKNNSDWGCIQCDNSSNVVVFNIDNLFHTCLFRPNCSQTNSKQQCIRCQTGYMLINASCYSVIQNCLEYKFNSVTKVNQCINCKQRFMNPQDNCKVSQDICQSFNYVLSICEVCNKPGYIMDQSGQFCIKLIANCIIYAHDGCAECEQQYVINPSNKSQCLFSSNVDYQIQTTKFSQDTRKIQTKITTLCLKNNYYQKVQILAIPQKCIKADSTFNISGNIFISQNCKVFDTNNKSCSQCIQGYYLNQSKCKECGIAIDKCLTCSNNCKDSICKPNCNICQPTHYIFLSQGQYICRQCSIYGCSKCQTDENQAIVCTQCQRGKTLYKNTCYSCPQGFELNIMTLQCSKCPQNCSSCSNGVCTWCNQNYARNDSNACLDIKKLQVTSINSSSTIFEMLSKYFPNQQTLIYNNEVELMSSCKGQATRFSCLCNSNQSSKISSMCYDLGNSIKLNISGVLKLPISTQTFLRNSQTLRLMAQLPAFDSLTFDMEFTNVTQIYFSQKKIACLLQIYAQVLRRQSVQSTANGRLLNVDVSLTLKKLFKIANFSFRDTLSRDKNTVIYGNGYYMKYYPRISQIPDTESQFVKILPDKNNTQPLFVFVWFDNLNTSKSLTGTIYAYSPLAPINIIVQIQQINYPSTTFSYQLLQNGKQSPISVSKITTNTLSFKMMTSTDVVLNYYDVHYELATAVDANNLFNTQRIQFIFYQSAFIYVLVFLVAYLFLIPCCALLDFISPKRAQHRKRVRSEDLSINQEGKPVNSQEASSSQQTIQISINYKDFFPIYNICNTPRPKRILKLCLFLLNTQHGITFLTLIYFGLGAGHPVVAVVIGIPAYFCTIIMGYICGVLTIVIPGWFKYLINLFVLGYWVLWVALMPRFSPEYQPYVIIFAAVFFILDLIIDCLEMFMVYFSIIKSQKQTKMFECLAAWLSKRGYYEYDQLAHQMHDEDN